MKYIEIGEMKIEDRRYADEICEVLEDNGFQTALINDTAITKYIRILKEEDSMNI